MSSYPHIRDHCIEGHYRIKEHLQFKDPFMEHRIGSKEEVESCKERLKSLDDRINFMGKPVTTSPGMHLEEH